MILSLLCLGSWASMFKFAGRWRFELFYLDFALGLFVAVLIYAFTVGNLGYDGFNFLDDLQHAGKRQWLYAFLAGLIFNFANMLLMAAVSVAGIAVAFPMTLGVALIVATAAGFVSRPASNMLLVTLGCLLLLTSVALNAVSYRMTKLQRWEEYARSGQAKSTRRPSTVKGIVLAVVSGLLMASFTPLLDSARAGDLGLGPYALAGMFALGMFLTTPVFGVFFMNLPVEGNPVDFTSYFKSKPKQHILGVLGGVIWCTGMLAEMIAASVPEQIQGPQVQRYLMAQAWPLVAALWGMIVLREFKGTDGRQKVMAVLMLVLFLCGLGMIAMGPLYVVRN
jgi:glucose uptake protein